EELDVLVECVALKRLSFFDGERTFQRRERRRARHDKAQWILDLHREHAIAVQLAVLPGARGLRRRGGSRETEQNGDEESRHTISSTSRTAITSCTAAFLSSSVAVGSFAVAAATLAAPRWFSSSPFFAVASACGWFSGSISTSSFTTVLSGSPSISSKCNFQVASSKSLHVLASPNTIFC